jgi:hypothetical protein
MVSAVNVTFTSTGGAHYLRAEIPEDPYYKRAPLTFKNRASYIYRTGVPLLSRCCILYIFSATISTEYFKHAAHSAFFSSKCRLFHNATFFGSCIIHILHTGVLKFKWKI